VSTYELEHLESDEEGVAVIALVGELDLTNVGALERRLESEVERDVALVVDLNRVVFVDSAALHCFFRLARARGRAQLAIVVEPTAPIARALDIVDLDRAATIVPTMADARAALSSAQPT
jgi:anti-anti-sigma factor